VLRKPVIAICVVFALAGTPAALAEDDPRTPVRRTLTLMLPDTGMAVVPLAYRVRATPTAGATRLRAAVQVRSARGWVTLRSSAPDGRGSAAGSLVSNRPGEKAYRAVLMSPQGRVLVTTPPATVTWSRLEHRVGLQCDRGSALIGVDVPCTVRVTPAVRLDDMIAVLQVRGRTDWVLVEASRLRTDGEARTHVNGFAPGIAEYRVILMRNAQVQAESSIATVAYSDGG
jgi:hypothetical protein